MKQRLLICFLCLLLFTACRQTEHPENTVTEYLAAAQNFQVSQQMNFLEEPLSEKALTQEKQQMETQKNADPELQETYTQLQKILKESTYDISYIDVKRKSAVVNVRIASKDIFSTTDSVHSTEVAIHLVKKGEDWKIKSPSAQEINAALLGSQIKLSDQSLYTDMQKIADRMQAKTVLKNYMDAAKEKNYDIQKKYLEQEEYIDTVKSHTDKMQNLFTGSDTLSEEITKHIDDAFKNLLFQLKEDSQKDGKIQVQTTVTTKETIAIIVDTINASIKTMNEELKKSPTLETKNRLEKEMFQTLDKAIQDAPERNIDFTVTLVKKDHQWKITNQSADLISAALFGSSNEKMFDPDTSKKEKDS